MALYDRLRSGTVPNLLSKFNTGVVEIGRPVSVPGIEPWDPPTITTEWTRIDAVATGVSQKYVDGSNIVHSDKEIITQTLGFDDEAGDQVRIDGKVVAILSVMPILAAGEEIAMRLIVRG